MPTRTTLLIADAFYPDELPPECKTNTYLAVALGQRGWNVAVWSHDGATVPKASPNLRFVRGAKHWGLGEVVRLSAWLLLHRPEQIIIMYHAALYSGRYEISWIPFIAWLLKLRCVTLFTNGAFPRRNSLQDRVLSLLRLNGIGQCRLGPFALSSRMIFLSESTRDKLLGSDPLHLESRCRITSPPTTLPFDAVVDRTAVRESLGLTSGLFLVAYFGLIYPGKGIEWLLEAMRILRSWDIDTKLIIIGPHGGVTSDDNWNSACQSYAIMLKKRVVELSIEDTVIWMDYCDDFGTVQYLSSCDVVCLPFDKGLDNRRSSFVTCAQIGLPVITTKSDTTDAVLVHAKTGITYVRPRDPQGIAKCLRLLYRDKATRIKRSSMLKRFAAKHYRNGAFVDSFDVSRPGD